MIYSFVRSIFNGLQEKPCVIICIDCVRYRKMTLSFLIDKPEQTVQTQIRLLQVWWWSTLFAIPSALFGRITLR